jgi:hypothetical protein
MQGLCPESQGHNLALTVFHMPKSLDSDSVMLANTPAVVSISPARSQHSIVRESCFGQEMIRKNS